MLRVLFLVVFLVHVAAAVPLVARPPLPDSVRIEVRQHPEKVYSGGVITLEGLIETVSYPRLEVESYVPNDVLLLGQESYPVTQLGNGRFQVGHVWVLQAIKPGVIDLSKLNSRLRIQGEVYENPIKIPIIEVQAYKDILLNDQLVAWDSSFVSYEESILKYWFLGLLVGGVMVFLIIRKYGVSNAQVDAESVLSVQDQCKQRIVFSLRRGKFPEKELESYLYDYGDQCEGLDKKYLEAILYSRAEVQGADYEKLVKIFQEAEPGRQG